MCVECGCEVPRTEQEEVRDGDPVVYLPAEVAGELEDRVPVAIDHEGTRIALVRTGEQWFAFDDTCTHQGCSLSKGHVERSSIVCPCHAGTFDMATGEVLAGPPPRPVRTYRVQIDEAERVA